MFVSNTLFSSSSSSQDLLNFMFMITSSKHHGVWNVSQWWRKFENHNQVNSAIFCLFALPWTMVSPLLKHIEAVRVVFACAFRICAAWFNGRDIMPRCIIFVNKRKWKLYDLNNKMCLFVDKISIFDECGKHRTCSNFDCIRQYEYAGYRH